MNFLNLDRYYTPMWIEYEDEDLPVTLLWSSSLLEGEELANQPLKKQMNNGHEEKIHK